MMSREASIGIDGVYYNPAGVVFMNEGHHLAINWQLAYQDRSIKNDYRSSMLTTKVDGRSKETSPSQVVVVSVPSTMVLVLLRRLYQRQP